MAACRAQEGQLKAFGKDLLRWGAIGLYWSLWAFTRLIWGLCWFMEKVYDSCAKGLTYGRAYAKLLIHK